MGQQKRSLIGHLTLTAWESWTAEAHWRNAVIIAVVGVVAYNVASPGSSAPNAQLPQTKPQALQIPQTMTSNGVMLTPISKNPIQLKPKILEDEVIFENFKDKESQNTFGRSHGE